MKIDLQINVAQKKWVFFLRNIHLHTRCIHVSDVVLKVNNDYFHIYYYTNKCK